MAQRLANLDNSGPVLWLLRAAVIALVLWGAIATIFDNPYSSREWFDLLVFGLVQGSLYALIAVGYTLVYDMLGLINFAHGEFFMAGAVTATIFVAGPMGNSGFLAQTPGLGLLIIAVVAVVASVLTALLTERVAFRPLREAPWLVSMIAALGASLFWRSIFQGLYGAEVIPFPQVPILSGTIPVFGTKLLKSHAVVILSSSLLFFGLSFFLRRTKTGKTLRAAAENKRLAVLTGVNLNRTVATTFAAGAAVAGVAGVLHALVFGKAHFFMGFGPGIKGFTAALLGGLGSIPGAFVGGLLLGIFENVGPGLVLGGLGIPAPYQLRDALAFAVLILIFVFRPQGIKTPSRQG